MFKRILVPVDGSETSAKALEAAAAVPVLCVRGAATELVQAG